MAFLTKAAGLVGGGAFGGGATGAFGKGIQSFFTGTPERNYQQSLLGPEQQPLYNQLQQSAMGRGAGGVYGQAADYYRDQLSDDSSTANMQFAPEMRRFNEQIIPGLSEQFAGMGSGGLSSSGFRNAAVNAGTDLSERLGSIRAQLRQNSVQGLQSIGQQGLGTYNENIHRPATPGFLESFAQGAGQGFGKAGSMYMTGGF